MKSISSLLYFIMSILLASCREDGTCDRSERVEFRDLKFQFPFRASEILDSLPDRLEIQESEIAFFQKHPKRLVRWFYEWDDLLNEVKDPKDILKQKRIYGVSIRLDNELKKTDTEILSELKSIYPGTYKHIKQYGNSYYLFQKNCLSIFFKRVYVNGRSTPEISFCYGLSSYEQTVYGYQTGNITSISD